MPSTAGKVKYGDVLQAFADLSEERGPTVRELQDRLGLSTTSLVDYRLNKLALHGFIEQRHPGEPRGWVLTLEGRKALADLRSMA